MKPARVIGAGLSGLVAAWHLADLGFAVTVHDRSNGPGGLIQTRQSAFGPVETAANAFVFSDTVAAWFQWLDLTAVFANRESRKRYIFRNDRPRRWPLSIRESAVMAARLGATAVSKGFAARDGESVAEWGDRVVGRPARQWILDPAMQGIYATPAEDLSARAIFGGRRRGRRELVAPAGGMGEFVTRLHARLVERGVGFEFAAAVDALDAKTPTVIATGAPEAARLLRPLAPELALCLGAIRVAPLVTVTMFFEPHDDDVRGFGVLFPRAAGVHALGVLFNADIFAGRGDLRSETWIAGDRGGMMGWTDPMLLKALAADRERLVRRHQEPLLTHVTRWSEAVPVYNEAIPAITAALASLPPQVALAGNYLGKIGVAALLEQSAAAAERLGRL